MDTFEERLAALLDEELTARVKEKWSGSATLHAEQSVEMSEYRLEIQTLKDLVHDFMEAEIERKKCENLSDYIADPEESPLVKRARIALSYTTYCRRLTCKAKASRYPDPQDCDWPVCGCDEYADKVIAALDESGLLKERP